MATILRGDDGFDTSKPSQDIPVFKVRIDPANHLTLTTGTYHEIAFNSVDVDTASGWNASTYRYTPPISGWYQVTLKLACGAGAIRGANCSVRKNGYIDLYDTQWAYSDVDDIGMCATGLMYLTPSDYISGYVYLYDVGSSTDVLFADNSQFQAHLVRAD